MLKHWEIRFSLNQNGTGARWQHRAQNFNFNHPVKHYPPETLFSDLLKRQSLRVMADMADITECPADTIGAHLARIDAIRELCQFAINHGQISPDESRLSGGQLCHPQTVADFLACLEITRRDHRAPAFVNSRDEQFARIEHKLDILAGLLATNDQAQQLFNADSTATIMEGKHANS